MYFQALCVLIVCSVVAAYAHYRFFNTSKATSIFHGVLQCRSALRGSTLESRAGPNERLADVFSIDNALTTVDPVYHAKFVKEVKGKLNTNAEQWKAFASFACIRFNESLLLDEVRKGDDTLIRLVPIIQSTVFCVVLSKFCSTVKEPGDYNVKLVTECINKLWLATKLPSSQADPSAAASKEELELQLRQIFKIPPNESFGGRTNPLNIIIPAYESLWRVVLRCFLEVRFRSQGKVLEDDSKQLRYHKIFHDFTSSPSPSTLATPPHSDPYFSIKHIVNEALRLYPPTRRIHRKLEDKMMKIDVEWLHRDPVSWGWDAEEFRPERWEGVFWNGKDGKPAFMPFRLGDLSCPAKTFAPIMIYVLVGALMEGVGDEWELFGGEMSGDILSTEVLDGGREAYAGLWLRKIDG